jgi:hypothetical protein
MATLKQALGRTKGGGDATPRLVTTQKILDHAEEIHEFSQKVFDNRMFNEKAKERIAWVEDQLLKYPHLFPSKKVKPNRIITKHKQYLEGDESKLITKYHSYTMTENQREEVDKVYELGHAYGKFIIKAVEIFDSKLAKRIKDNYKAIMLKNNERYKFITGQRTQDFRILVHQGNLVVIEHQKEHYQGCSWHDIDGTIKTSKTISAGTIRRKQ